MITLSYPVIDPVLLELGPLTVRWYALSYIAGILFSWRFVIVLAKKSPIGISKRHIDDFLVWATLGIVFGGRLGYVLFYKPTYYFNHPLETLIVWQGGMTFHGGLLGVIIATWLFSKLRGYSLVGMGDIVACTVPVGIFLGRLANFVNGELYGRITDSPLGMVFPNGGPLPRHPSQLYEALLEGIVLFTVLLWFSHKQTSFERRGFLAGVFLTGYAIARAIAEQFREPDIHLGYILMATTMGQWLSLPVLIAGLWLIWRSRKYVRA